MSERHTPIDGNDLVNIKPFFGRIELESRVRRDGLRLICEGRSLHYDGAGKLTRDTGWTATGVEMEAPDLATALQMESLCARP